MACTYLFYVLGIQKPILRLFSLVSIQKHTRFKVSPVFVDGEHFEHDRSLLNFNKGLITNHATFDTQLEPVSASRVHT